MEPPCKGQALSPAMPASALVALVPGWRQVLALNACLCPGWGQGRGWPRQPAQETFSPNPPAPLARNKIGPIRPHPRGLAKSCQVQSGGSGQCWWRMLLEGAQEGAGSKPLASDLAAFCRLSPLPPPGETQSCTHGIGMGKGVAACSWLSCHPPRAPSVHQAGRARAVARGAVTGVLKLGSPSSPRVCAVVSSRLLPPGWAGWVAVGAGSQAGCFPTPCPALWPEVPGLQFRGRSPASPPFQLRGHPPVLVGKELCHRHQAVSAQGWGWRLRAFAGFRLVRLQTPGFSWAPACPQMAPPHTDLVTC